VTGKGKIKSRNFQRATLVGRVNRGVHERSKNRCRVTSAFNDKSPRGSRTVPKNRRNRKKRQKEGKNKRPGTRRLVYHAEVKKRLLAALPRRGGVDIGVKKKQYKPTGLGGEGGNVRPKGAAPLKSNY